VQATYRFYSVVGIPANLQEQLLPCGSAGHEPEGKLPGQRVRRIIFQNA
jgi:hypothetical protein